MPPAAPQTWTTRELLGWMTKAFEAKDLDSPRRMAEMLLAHIIGCDRLRLYMDNDRPASPIERETLRELVRRALSHEPIQYLVGEESFFGMTFHVDKRVLIPRPSTQTLIDEVLNHARKNPDDRTLRESDAGVGMMIADVCTGSGCIAAALAKNLPGARVIASDLSVDALEVAQLNITRHELDERVDLVQGDLLKPIFAHPVAGQKGAMHYLCSNPPYIPDHEWTDDEPHVKDHAPTMALRAARAGMEFIALQSDRGPELQRSGGLLLIEIAACNANACLQLATDHPQLDRARIVKDSDGYDRILIAQRV